MTKIRVAYRGKVLKRSLLTHSIVIERMEYPSMLSGKQEMVSYDVATIILHGQVTPIEKPIGTTLWYRSMEDFV